MRIRISKNVMEELGDGGTSLSVELDAKLFSRTDKGKFVPVEEITVDSGKDIPEHVQRMIAEHRELRKRTDRLRRFIDDRLETDKDIPEEYGIAMLAQYHAMEAYDSALMQRLCHHARVGDCTGKDINED